MNLVLENRSRSVDVPIDLEQDWVPLKMILDKVSIAFPEALEVEVDGVVRKVGKGFGALSWSLWVRSDGCTLCGQCCQQPRRRTWFWTPDQKTFPQGLKKLPVRVNGEILFFPYNIQEGTWDTVEACTYLEPVTDDRGTPVIDPVTSLEMKGCSLYRERPEEDLRPSHCIASPFLSLYDIRYAELGRKVYTLSKRLPPRNWRWPKCPIDIYAPTGVTPRSFENDRRTLRGFVDAFGNLPESQWQRVFSFWEETARRSMMGYEVPKETVFIERILS